MQIIYCSTSVKRRANTVMALAMLIKESITKLMRSDEIVPCRVPTVVHGITNEFLRSFVISLMKIRGSKCLDLYLSFIVYAT